MVEGSLSWMAGSAQKYIHSVLCTSIGAVQVQCNTEIAFCTKEEKDAQVNNCYFLLLQDFTLISLSCIREPHTHL